MTVFHTKIIPHVCMKKNLLNGFLTSRDRVRQEVEKSAEQGKLL